LLELQSFRLGSATIWKAPERPRCSPARRSGTMGRMIALYGLGFAAVWVAVLAGCLGSHFRRRAASDWDRAFERELEDPRSTADPSRVSRSPESRRGSSRETDPI
jgi:hypothetical protein